MLDVTYYLNFTSQLVGSYNVNQIDPRVAYEYKAATNVAVAESVLQLLDCGQVPRCACAISGPSL